MARRFYRKTAAVRDLRQLPGNGDDTLASDAAPEAPEDVGDEPSYRDLQAQAKAAGIPANQTADELKAALAKR